MTSLVDELSDDQKLMVETIYLSFADRGMWPDWRYIKRRFRQQSNTDPKAVRESFPVIGRRGDGLSYSVIYYNPHDLSDRAIHKLSIAAALHVQGYERTASNLVEVIQYFAKEAKAVDPDAGAIKFTRDRLARVLNWDPDVMHNIPDFLHHEPLPLIAGSAGPVDGNWEVTLDEESLIPYSGVSTIKEYVEKTTELVTALVTYMDGGMTSTAVGTQAPMTVAVTGGQPQYISDGLIDKLESLQPKDWHLGKLIAMLRELNAVYAAEQQYSSLMLCRAIMDHVPPVFGHKTFADVASQVSMSQTDKKYLTLLRDDRFVSDDALHRHISNHADVIELQDVPKRLWMNALVRLTIDGLS